MVRVLEDVLGEFGDAVGGEIELCQVGKASESVAGNRRQLIVADIQLLKALKLAEGTVTWEKRG